MEKKTPLYEKHLQAGGKIVPFAGYLLPVQYQGVIAEHMAVRQSAGLFDVSHMGEIMFSGKDALGCLNSILTNSFTGMYEGQARYSLMCNERGGTVDDVIVYKLKDKYMVVVNASNREKDFEWMKAHASGEAVIEDASDRIAQIALQGPKSREILGALTGAETLPERYYSCREDCVVSGIDCIISKTGYTGEDGYEFYVKSEDGPKLWDILLAAGREHGLVPCGLGARDTLRLEASMPLYGHELNEEITPAEAGLMFAVDLNKPFIGREAITGANKKKKRAGLKALDKGIIREGQDVYLGTDKVGTTTSGTFCPYLGGACAMAYIDIDNSNEGAKLEIDVRGRRIAAEVVALPFYKKTKSEVKA